MTVDPNESEVEKTETSNPDIVEGLVPEQIEIDVDDPTLTGEFNEADFDHEFDDDFEEEIEGEYELEDDQYGEDFNKEFGHLTEDEEDKGGEA